MRETRAYSSRGMDTSVELRDAGGVKTLVGYAAVWNRYSQNLGGFVEVIEPRAFTEALAAGNNIAGLGNHDPNWLLGTTGSGTLRLTQDEVGLRYEITLDPTDPDAQRMMSKVATGKLPGSSFSFQMGQGGDSWGQTEKGFPLRTIRSVKAVFDVGPVTFPAYLDTQSADAATALRSLAEVVGKPVDELVAAAGRNELRSFLPGSEVRDMGMEVGPHPLTPRQNAMCEAACEVVGTFGKFDQSSGPDGAHYMAESPFPDLRCANCALYDGQRMCEVVDGDISPDAVCKLWIIPADLVAGDAAPADPATDPAQPPADLGMGAGLPTRSDPRQNPDVIARLRLLAQTRQF